MKCQTVIQMGFTCSMYLASGIRRENVDEISVVLVEKYFVESGKRLKIILGFELVYKMFALHRKPAQRKQAEAALSCFKEIIIIRVNTAVCAHRHLRSCSYVRWPVYGGTRLAAVG